jgi:hypothetical protein
LVIGELVDTDTSCSFRRLDDDRTVTVGTSPYLIHVCDLVFVKAAGALEDQMQRQARGSGARGQRLMGRRTPAGYVMRLTHPVAGVGSTLPAPDRLLEGLTPRAGSAGAGGLRGWG